MAIKSASCASLNDVAASAPSSVRGPSTSVPVSAQLVLAGGTPVVLFMFCMTWTPDAVVGLPDQRLREIDFRLSVRDCSIAAVKSLMP
ncbi:hypothetical protein D3C87_1895470 [compost metagenome]